MRDPGANLAHAIAEGTITREASCDRKQAYRTPDYAERIARRVGKQFGTPMRWYFCQFCYCYHITKDTEG